MWPQQHQGGWQLLYCLGWYTQLSFLGGDFPVHPPRAVSLKLFKSCLFWSCDLNKPAASPFWKAEKQKEAKRDSFMWPTLLDFSEGGFADPSLPLRPLSPPFILSFQVKGRAARRGSIFLRMTFPLRPLQCQRQASEVHFQGRKGLKEQAYFSLIKTKRKNKNELWTWCRSGWRMDNMRISLIKNYWAGVQFTEQLTQTGALSNQIRPLALTSHSYDLKWCHWDPISLSIK